MKYIIVPAEVIEQVPKSELEALHLNPRYSTDRTEVIMKVIHYEQLFPVPMTLELVDELPNEPIYPYPLYEAPSEELDVLITSPKWTEEERV